LSSQEKTLDVDEFYNIGDAQDDSDDPVLAADIILGMTRTLIEAGNLKKADERLSGVIVLLENDTFGEVAVSKDREVVYEKLVLCYQLKADIKAKAGDQRSETHYRSLAEAQVQELSTKRQTCSVSPSL